MNARDIYKSGYSFAKKQDDKRVKWLKIVSLILPLIIFLVLCMGFISSLDLFSKKEETVSKIFEEQEKERELEIAKALTIEQNYKEAKIPYVDPAGNFSIIFMTPFVSDQIGVVINNEKEYDKSKAEADQILNAARSRAAIDSVTYIKNY